jgi:hypothetical protein
MRQDGTFSAYPIYHLGFLIPAKENRMKHVLITLSLTLCLLISVSSDGLAYSSYGPNFQAEYPGACETVLSAATSEQNCMICHTSGFGLNGYGEDFNQNGRNYAAIEGMDSDGDSYSNIQEILTDCSLPGDETSTVPVEADSWNSVKALYR